ncbi:hypothetical protein TNCV_1515281 [Trichonephila clavipes]|nr:hypothetical protein TNCV_1515281 [Trichonephila clavipes]
MAVNNVRGSAVTLFPEVPYTKVVPISVYVSGSEANFRVSIPQKNVLNLSMDIGKEGVEDPCTSNHTGSAIDPKYQPQICKKMAPPGLRMGLDILAA